MNRASETERASSMAKSKVKRSETLPKIEFNGWRNPQKTWKQWVDRLAVTKAEIWEKSGISEAIRASTYKIRRDDAVIVGLAEFWVPSMNAFEFNFGAATITLEDLMGLGGYSAFGEPVSVSVSGELLEIQDKIAQKHKWFYNNTSQRKPSFSLWMNHFMENCDDEVIEHVGFLALWLSRFVFPVNGDSVSRNVFSIAVHLAHGTRIALGQAVLASIYRDLRILNDHVLASHDFPCTVWAPLQLLQLWAWERFVLLSPYVANKTRNGDPLAAKWQGFKSKMTLEEVRSIVKSEKNFRWRCFGFNVESEMWFSGEQQRTLGFDLIGFGCREKYFPRRVRKQFWVDQEKLNEQVLINNELDHKESIMGLERSNESPTSMDIDDEDLMFSERFRVLNCQSVVGDDGVDHLTLNEGVKLMQQKSLFNCDEKSSFSVQEHGHCSSTQSQTSAPSPLMISELGAAAAAREMTANEVSDEDLLGVEDEGEGLELRVSKLERDFTEIKARLKAELMKKGIQ